MSDTPRTDAQHAKWRIDDDPYTDMMKLARQLETELAACDACRLLELKAAERLEGDIAAMRDEMVQMGIGAARWSIASEYMTAHNRSIVEGLIPDILPYAAPQTPGVPGLGRAHALSAEPAVAAPVRKVFSPFDPNARLYAALNLLEQIYEEVDRQKWPVDSHWATAVKNVLNEHGWSA